jgi:integrase
VGNDDPLFPATSVERGEGMEFKALGIKRAPWATATPIRVIFRQAFEAAGLPYYNPHSLRSTLVQLGERVCQTPEQFKAWSQSLGHEGVLTTFLSYGAVATPRQGEIIRGLAKGAPSAASGSADDIAEALFRLMQQRGVKVESSA